MPPFDTPDDPVALRKFYESSRNIEAREPEVKKAALAATVVAPPQKTGLAHELLWKKASM